MKKPDVFLIQLTGLLFFGTLFIFSWIFYKERMLNFDPAFFSFRIIYERDYNVELGRWGSIVSQVIPLWFLKIGVGLETFLRIYSVSFILIYYLIFQIITCVLKNKAAALTLMFTLCLTFRHAFYYSTAELYQGLALCVLVLALIGPAILYEDIRRKVIAGLIVFALIYVMSYYHQILLFPLLFVFLYIMISNGYHKNRLLIVTLIFTCVWFFIRIRYLTGTAYEQSKIPSVRSLVYSLDNFYQTLSFDYLRHFALNFLLLPIALNAICIAQMMYQRKWLLVAFYVASNIGFVYLVIVTYGSGDSPLMYENYITILGLFCALPLTELLLKFRRLPVVYSLTAVILFVSVKEIYASHQVLSDRVQYLHRLTERGRSIDEKKYIIEKRNFAWDYGWVSWALPFETLLYSSLKSPDSAITVCAVSPITAYDSVASWKYVFLGPDWSPTWFWTRDFDAAYFRLPSGNYKKLTSLQSDSGFREGSFDKTNVKMTALEDTIIAGRERFITIPVQIENSSGNRIYATPDSGQEVAISYHVYSASGSLVVWDGYRTYLESDVDDRIDQAVVFENNLPEGNYIVQMDFITERKRWWKVNAEVLLQLR